MHSSAVPSLLVFLFYDVIVGLRESDERRSVGTGTGGTPTGGFRLRINVCVLAIWTTRGHTGRGYGIFVVTRRRHSTP